MNMHEQNWMKRLFSSREREKHSSQSTTVCIYCTLKLRYADANCPIDKRQPKWELLVLSSFYYYYYYCCCCCLQQHFLHWHFMCLKRIFFLALQILFPFRWVFIWFVFDKVNTMAFYQVHCVWFAAKCKEEMQPNSSRLYNTHAQDAMIYLLFSYLLTFQCYCKNILAS